MQDFASVENKSSIPWMQMLDRASNAIAESRSLHDFTSLQHCLLERRTIEHLRRILQGVHGKVAPRFS